MEPTDEFLEEKYSDELSRYTSWAAERRLRQLREWEEKPKVAKWKMTSIRKDKSRKTCEKIIFHLDSYPKGFNQLKETIGLSSPSFLSKCLKRLMINGLIERQPISRKYRLKEEVKERQPGKGYFVMDSLTPREKQLLKETPMPSSYFFRHEFPARGREIAEKVAVHFYPEVGMRRVDIPEHIRPKFESVLKRLFLPLYDSLFPRTKRLGYAPREDFKFNIMINVEGKMRVPRKKNATKPIAYPELFREHLYKALQAEFQSVLRKKSDTYAIHPRDYDLIVKGAMKRIKVPLDLSL